MLEIDFSFLDNPEDQKKIKSFEEKYKKTKEPVEDFDFSFLDNPKDQAKISTLQKKYITTDPSWGAQPIPTEETSNLKDIDKLVDMKDLKDEVESEYQKKINPLVEKRNERTLTPEEKQQMIDIESERQKKREGLAKSKELISGEESFVKESAPGVFKEKDTGKIIYEKPIESDLLDDPIFNAITFGAGIGVGTAKAMQLGGWGVAKEGLKGILSDLSWGLTDVAKLGVKGVKALEGKLIKSKVLEKELQGRALEQAMLNDLKNGTNEAELLKKSFAVKDADKIAQDYYLKKQRKGLKDKLAIQIWDNNHNARKALEDVVKKANKTIAEGKLPAKEIADIELISKSAEHAVQRRVLQSGAGEKAMETMKYVDKEVLGPLTKPEIEILGSVRNSLRESELSGREVFDKSIKGATKKYDAEIKKIDDLVDKGIISPEQKGEILSTIKPPEKTQRTISTRLTKEENDVYIKYRMTDRIKQANEKLQKVYDGQLEKLYKEGILSKESLDYMRANGMNYDPRIAMKYLDPAEKARHGGKGSNSGLPYLETGTDDPLYNDVRYALNDYVGRTESMIYRNRANKALHDYALKDPDTSIARVLKDGETIGPKEDTVKAFIDGQEKKIVMPAKLAKEWNGMDPLLTETQAKWASIISGNKILKLFATGINPVFAIRNIIRDAAYIYMSPEYKSAFLPKAIGQMLTDYKQTAKAAFTNTGLARDYVELGGGMGRESLTFSSQTGAKSMKHIEDFLGKAGEVSERWTRLAHMNRVLKNGRSKAAAAFIARDALDFNQGGQVVKALNAMLPYVNAGMQGTRGMGKFFMKDKGLFGWKLANLAGLSMALYGWNNYGDHKADYDKLSPHLKASTFAFWTPFTYKDENNETQRFFLHFPKDPFQSAFTSVCDNVIQGMVGHDVDLRQSASAISNFLSIVPTSSGMMPPLARAFAGYEFNKDLFRNEDIWKPEEVAPEEQYYSTTPEIYKKVGQTAKTSPVKLKYMMEQFFSSNNLFATAFGLGLDKILKEGTEEDQKRWNDILSKEIGLGIYRRTWMDYKKYYKAKDEKLNIQTEQWINKRKQNEAMKKGEMYIGEEEEFGLTKKGLSKRYKQRLKSTNILDSIENKKDYKIWQNIMFESTSPQSAAAQVYKVFGQESDYEERIKPLIGKLKKAYPRNFVKKFFKYLNYYERKGLEEGQ